MICHLVNRQSTLHLRPIQFLILWLIVGPPGKDQVFYMLQQLSLRAKAACIKKLRLYKKDDISITIRHYFNEDDLLKPMHIILILIVLTMHASCGPESRIALFHNRVISLNVVSLDMNDEKTCFSCSIVITPIAFGMILAVFSLVTTVTERTGICS